MQFTFNGRFTLRGQGLPQDSCLIQLIRDLIWHEDLSVKTMNLNNTVKSKEALSLSSRLAFYFKGGIASPWFMEWQPVKFC